MTQAKTNQILPTSPNALTLGTSEQSSRHEPHMCAIETQDFPFEYISRIAKLESWRKEINRPIYHIHKWWAQRLGSVFRAIVLATFAPKDADVLELFYSPARLSNMVVFDPFMGSGTTIGEVLKAGGRAIGRDINPVAWFLVKNALSMPSRDEVLKTFQAIESDISQQIQHFYRARLNNGTEAPVLYYFWVQQVVCPDCNQAVDLFASYIFAQHAYPKRHPEAQALCPVCGFINRTNYDSRHIECSSCHSEFDPHSGPARVSKATCPHCGNTFLINQAVRKQGKPPTYRQYAKIVLTPDGEKIYLPADDFDRALYRSAKDELKKRGGALPLGKIKPGYNTDQILKYEYTDWHQLFNARQLLCLNMLANRIKTIPNERNRDLFCCLFSGTLEFNNMFTSFKGEGTGAVRHMFSHHILKPERRPLEANPWGTRKSSGAFSTLFKSRILRAIDYSEKPFEIRVMQNGERLSSEKVFGLSRSLVSNVVSESLEEFMNNGTVYLSCGDSRYTELASESVDAVITDPPFFDNVHYSQLADFFYGWQRYILGPLGVYARDSTRHQGEVQHTDVSMFTDRLTEVWRECHRVLKKDGLLVFTYHHSRLEGWRSVLISINRAGFCVVAVHPIKSEMSVAIPKRQAREPIDIDIILVCRKLPRSQTKICTTLESVIERASVEAEAQVLRLHNTDQVLSRNDIKAIFMAQVVTILSRSNEESAILDLFNKIESEVEAIVNRIHTK